MQRPPSLPAPYQLSRPADEMIPPASGIIFSSVALQYIQRIADLENNIIIGEATLKAANARLEDELDEVYLALQETSNELTEVKAEAQRQGVEQVHDQQQTLQGGDASHILAETALHRYSAEQQSRQHQEIRRLTLLASHGSRALEKWKSRSDQLERDCATIGVEYRFRILQNKQLLAERDVALKTVTIAEGHIAELQKSLGESQEVLQRERSERRNERDIAERTMAMVRDNLNDAEIQNRQLVERNGGYGSEVNEISVALAGLASRQTVEHFLAGAKSQNQSLTDAIHQITSELKLLTAELYSATLNIRRGLHELEITNDELTDELKTSQAEIQRMMAKKETLQTDVLHRTEQVIWMRQSVEEMARDLTEARRAKDDALSRVEALLFEKDTLLARLQSTIGRMQEAESALEDGRKDLDAQRIEMWVLQQRWDAAMKDLGALRAGYSAAASPEQHANLQERKQKAPVTQRQLSCEVLVQSDADKQVIVPSDSGIARVQVDVQVRAGTLMLQRGDDL
ncbi:hypothetical protein NCC49_003220 [Naganishia albida]|nr:hypothetical protein NCC49_003220 [Naganishia albida]